MELPFKCKWGITIEIQNFQQYAWPAPTLSSTRIFVALVRLTWPKGVSDARHCGRVQELETCCPIIDKIYNSPGSDSEWAISGAGGDMALPGAVECQGLHRDSAPPDLGLDIGGKSFQRRSSHARSMELANYIEVLLKDLRDGDEDTPGSEMSLYTMRALSETMPPSGTINFLLADSTWENGPIRTILGSHCNVQQPPKTDEEPEWMRLSTLVGAPGNTSTRTRLLSVYSCVVWLRVLRCLCCPAGSAIFRDHRVWHSGTPNLSDEVRAMPNIEWAAAWTAGRGMQKVMPHHIWEQLSDRGKHNNRFVHADPGLWPSGAGVMHPLASGRLAAFEAMGGLAATKADAGIGASVGKPHRSLPERPQRQDRVPAGTRPKL